MNVKSLVFLVLVTVCNAQSPAPKASSPKVWTDWVSEGKALVKAGNYSSAIQDFRQAMAMATGNVSAQNLVEIHDALASVYAETGQYTNSADEYRRALALVEKSAGRRSIQYAYLSATLALLPTQTGNRDSVIALLRDAIANASPANPPAGELPIVRVCLAQILMEERRYAEAEPVLLEAQASLASLKTPDPKLLAEVLNGLGILRFNQRRYAESVEFYRESLRLLADQKGDGHPSLVVPLTDLALSYFKLGMLQESEMVLRRAMAVCSKSLGEDHPLYGALLEDDSILLRKLGRKREARALKVRSEEIARASQRRNGVGSTIGVAAFR